MSNNPNNQTNQMGLTRSQWKNKSYTETPGKAVSYALYMHRLELQRPKRCFRVMRIATTKLLLTNELIWMHANHWKEENVAPSYEDCDALNRERDYRDRLENNMRQHMQKVQQRKRQYLEANRRRRAQEHSEMESETQAHLEAQIQTQKEKEKKKERDDNEIQLKINELGI